MARNPAARLKGQGNALARHSRRRHSSDGAPTPRHGAAGVSLGEESIGLPWYVLLPDTTFHLVWDLGMIMFILIGVIFWPFAIAFDVPTDLWWYTAMVVLSRIFFAADLVVDFVTTSVNKKGFVLTEIRDIVHVNLRNGLLVVDILALLFPFVKVFRVPDLLNNKRLWEKLANFSSAILYMSFFKMCVIFFSIAHLFTCGWYYIFLQEYIEKGEDDGFQEGQYSSDDDFQGPYSLYDKYTICFMETVGMLLGAGAYTPFRDPVDVLHKLYTMMVCSMGAILQAWVFGQVATSLSRAGERGDGYRQHMSTMARRMTSLDLPDELRHRVVNFNKQLWLSSGSFDHHSDDFIDKVSPPVRTAIKMVRFAEMVQRIPFLKGVSRICVEALVMLMKPQEYLTGDVVVQKGNRDNWMGFINEGELAIVNPGTELGENNRNYVHDRLSCDDIIKFLGIGDFFGELALMQDVARTCSIVASRFCSLNVLYRDDFVHIEQSHPEDWAHISKELNRFQSKAYRDRMTVKPTSLELPRMLDAVD
jgi:CRP-like cAMP-binding protein